MFHGSFSDGILMKNKIVRLCCVIGSIPNIEKKIMKPADIWMTLRLPTLVNANRPAFSLRAVMRRKIW